jgi:hypothetical protein
MKTFKNLVITAVLSGAIIASALAGSWGHGVYQQGDYSTHFDVPSIAYVTISLENYDGKSINSSPLGYYSVESGQWFTNQGYCNAGTYYIYQSVVGSGWSATAITW